LKEETGDIQDKKRRSCILLTQERLCNNIF
jgi:hypothetical protein